MRNTDKIRFYVLKTLKDFPNIHGYQLYLTFKKKNMVKNPSQLYKILRSMKRKGYIFSREEESDKGPNKKVLHLTKEGEQAYYIEVLDHIKIIADLIVESRFRVGSKDFKLKTLENKINSLQDKKIYLDMRYMPNIVKRNIMVNKIIPFIKENNLKVYIDKIEGNLVFPIDSLIQNHFVILDENVGLKENSIDFILTSTNLVTKKFFNDYHRLKRVLNDRGEILIGYVNSRESQGEYIHFGQMFHRIFKVLENELPAEYEDLFFKEVEMFQDFDARQVKIYTFDDLVKEVRSDFKKVKVLEGFGRFQTIVASEKK